MIEKDMKLTAIIRRDGDGNTYRWAIKSTSGEFISGGDFTVDKPDDYHEVMQEFMYNMPQCRREKLIAVELDIRKDSERWKKKN